MRIKMKPPKALKTAHWVLGYNVQGKEIIEVDERDVARFKQLGYKIVKETKRGDKKK